MKAFNIMATIVAVLLLAVPMASADAYSGYNTIGNYQQYQYAQQGSYLYTPGTATGGYITLPNPYYAYPTTPRAGGWFGGSSGWITGLRTPFYGYVTPTHLGNFYRPTYGSYGYGGYGYGSYGSRYTSSFGFDTGATAPIRTRYGAGI